MRRALRDSRTECARMVRRRASRCLRRGGCASPCLGRLPWWARQRWQLSPGTGWWLRTDRPPASTARFRRVESRRSSSWQRRKTLPLAPPVRAGPSNQQNRHSCNANSNQHDAVPQGHKCPELHRIRLFPPYHLLIARNLTWVDSCDDGSSHILTVPDVVHPPMPKATVLTLCLSTRISFSDTGTWWRGWPR